VDGALATDASAGRWESVRDRFYVYVLANLRGRRPVLYVGVTNDMNRRLSEHRLRPTGFVRRYHVTTLVYLEWTADIRSAIAREKKIKGWVRAKKLALIEQANPTWRDLSCSE
jgi:putative endonuclease